MCGKIQILIWEQIGKFGFGTQIEANRAGIAGRRPGRKPGTAGQPMGHGPDPGGRVPRLTKNFILN